MKLIKEETKGNNVPRSVWDNGDTIYKMFPASSQTPEGLDAMCTDDPTFCYAIKSQSYQCFAICHLSHGLDQRLIFCNTYCNIFFCFSIGLKTVQW